MKLTYKHTVLSCYLAYISSAAANNLPALLFIIFQTDFGLTTTQLASLVTFNFFTQIIVDVLGAKYSDRVGYRGIAIISEAFLAVGLVCIGILPMIMGNKYLALVIASIVYAIGSGLGEVIISPMIEALPCDAKESAMSILHSFYCWGFVGVVTLSTLYFYVFGTDEWYVLPILWAIVPVITLVMFSVVPIRELNDSAPSMPLTNLFKTKVFWLFLLLMICGGAAEQAMGHWASLFAEAALGVSKTVGDLAGPCLFAIFMGLSRVFYGKKSAKVDLTKVMLGCGSLCVICYLLAALSPIPIIGLIGCALCGLAVGIMWPGTISISSQKCPKGGTAMFAFLALAGDLGAAVGPTMVGGIADAVGGNLKTGLLFAALFPIVMILGLVPLVKKSGKNNF